MNNMNFVRLLLLVPTISLQAMNILYDKNEFIDLDQNKFSKVADYWGNKNNINFYKEYRSYKLKDNGLSFPLKSCDPLEIKSFGDIRYFLSSVISNRTMPLFMGTAFEVINPDTTNIIVVRGKDDTNQVRGELYIGFDKSKFVMKGNKKVYAAEPLVLQTKSTKNVEKVSLRNFCYTNLSLSQKVMLEVSKYITDRKDSNVNSPKFIEV